jgi:hypothetical protein
VSKIKTAKPLFFTDRISETEVTVRCIGGLELRWATLEKPLSRWIVRRFDWFDPTPLRDPSFKQAVESSELRELLSILDELNEKEAI